MNAETPRQFRWDYREQPPMGEIAAAVAELSAGIVRMTMPETGSDEYELTIEVAPSVIRLARELSEADVARLREDFAKAARARKPGWKKP